MDIATSLCKEGKTDSQLRDEVTMDGDTAAESAMRCGAGREEKRPEMTAGFCGYFLLLVDAVQLPI